MVSCEVGDWVKVTGFVRLRAIHWAAKPPKVEYSPTSAMEPEKVIVIGRVLRKNGAAFKTIKIEPKTMWIVGKRLKQKIIQEDKGDVMFIKYEKIEQLSKKEAFIYGL